MHPAIEAIRVATMRTSFENDVYLVGGAVREELLGRTPQDDLDLVTRGSAIELAKLLHEGGLSEIPPVTYERFGTALVRVRGTNVEMVTARKESYNPESRKPFVEPATYEDDARRRDFTVNALLRSVHTGELLDPLGMGRADLDARILRTPLDPEETFTDDPLRMLRAVRFRWKLGFAPAEGLYDAIQRTRERLEIVSMERIRDELVKMLLHDSAPDALRDLNDLGLLELFAPELSAMAGVEQGHYHHLDVWEHSLLVLQNVGPGDLILSLGALLHDVGKPSTRFIDEKGNTRFFGHEAQGANLTRKLLGRLRFPQREIEEVAQLVRHHMRFGSSPQFTPTAARRVLRDLGPNLERLLALVEADADGLKRNVKRLDLAPIRQQIERVRQETPVQTLQSPLSGAEIMALTGLESGPEIGQIKNMLTEAVLEGKLLPGDKQAAARMLPIGVRNE